MPLAADPFGTNALQPLDVTRNGAITAQDALEVINAIARSSTAGSADPSNEPGLFIDVNGDGSATAFDALQVINALARQAPLLAATLPNDSAPDGQHDLAMDLITQEFALDLNITAGQLDQDPVLIHIGEATSSFVDITERFDGGVVTLTQEDIESFAGGALDDGDHQVIVLIGSTDNIKSSIEFQITLDRTAPEIQFQNLASGDLRTLGAAGFRLEFSERLAKTSLTSDAFHVLTQLGQELPIQSFFVSPNQNVVQFEVNTTDLGEHLLQVDASKLIDRTGIPISASNFGTEFQVQAKQASLFPAQVFDTSEQFKTIINIDVNGDGSPDLVTANEFDETVSVLLGRVDGGFDHQQSIAVTGRPTELIGEDFNGDGISDLALASSWDKGFSVLLGRPDGSFASPQVYGPDYQYIDIDTGDFDQDGIPDIVVLDSTGNFSIFLGKSDSTFSMHTELAFNVSARSLIVRDVNDDDLVDVVLTSQASNSAGYLTMFLGDGDGGLMTRSDYRVGSLPQQVIADDFNNDAIIDLAVTNEESDNLSVLYGMGEGLFAEQQTFSVGNSPRGLASGDFNLDGIKDIAVGSASTQSVNTGDGLWVLHGDPAGGFAEPMQLATDGRFESLTVADLNHDGVDDLAAAESGDHQVLVLLGKDGGGLRGNATFVDDFDPSAIATDDFNNDGNADLVATNHSTATATILLGNGSGDFTEASIVATGLDPKSPSIGDFNRDGVPDIAIANSSGRSISVLLGLGDGTFDDHRTFATDRNPASLVVTDFDGDGMLDLATLSEGGNDQLSILLGSGDGEFGSAKPMDVGSFAKSFAVDDFDGDGQIDIAVSLSFLDRIRLFRNVGNAEFELVTTIDNTEETPIAVIAADFNGDGNADLANLNRGRSFTGGSVSILLGGGNSTFSAAIDVPIGPWPTDFSVTDFNADGTLDLVVGDGSDRSLLILVGNGDGTFDNFQTLYGGNSIDPIASAIGDFNNDGTADIAVVNEDAGDLALFLGTGDGQFSQGTQIQAKLNSDHLISADFNGDGLTDVAAITSDNDRVTILLSDGQGGLTLFQTLNTGTASRSIITDDFNGDGIIDLAVGNYLGGGVSILIGGGDGSFTVLDDSPDGAYISLASGDFDGDLVPDIAAVSRFTNSVSIFRGVGNGSFVESHTFAVANDPIAIAASDFNRDGHLDLVVGSLIEAGTFVYLGSGEGFFVRQPNQLDGAYHASIVADDFNGDGASDIALFDSGNTISVASGLGEGQFAQPQYLQVPGNPTRLITGDFNGDGFVDIATTTRFSGSVSLILGDGSGGFAQPLFFLAGEGASSLAIGDFNGDGIIDIATANSYKRGITLILGNPRP